MHATFIRDIKIKTAIAYLVFEKEQDRSDIVSFLNGNKFEDDLINERVKTYLRKLHILDESDSLTKKGERIKQTGKLFIREEGKYQIWFTENDDFLGTKILYFERISPQKETTINKINVDFEEENYFLPIKNNEFSILKLIIETDNIYGQIKNDVSNIELIWEWKNLESSYFFFSGKINDNPIKKREIECNKELEEYILKIFPEWDYNHQRLKIEFRNIINEDERRSFKTSYSNNNQSGFKEIEFIDIPIMPFDKQDAIKWRNWFIEQEIKKDYYLKYDFEKLVKEINNKEGFSAYKDTFSVPDITEFRDNVYNKDRAKQSASFWHLSAPDDLNPDVEKKYILKSLEYASDEEISLAEIVKGLIENTKNEINAVFYYDKYTYTDKQQKNLVAFFNAFENVEDKRKFLITITHFKGKKRSNIINKNTNINVIDVKNIFQGKTQHNRYIILAKNKEKYTVWELPASFDFIEFDENEVTFSTKGKIIDSITFNQVEKKILKPELRNYIENKL